MATTFNQAATSIVDPTKDLNKAIAPATVKTPTTLDAQNFDANGMAAPGGLKVENTKPAAATAADLQPVGAAAATPAAPAAAKPPTLAAGVVPDAMKADWNSYFDTAKPGETINWGGGTLTMGADGEAIYKAANSVNGGNVLNRNSIDSNGAWLSMLAASSPGVAKQWADQYGYNAGEGEAGRQYWDGVLASQGRTRGDVASGGNPAAPGAGAATGATATTPGAPGSPGAPGAVGANPGAPGTPGPAQPSSNGLAQTVVDPTKTTQGLINSMLQEDSPYLQRARALAQEKMNDRGLSSSSMAQGAGVAAAIDAALGIATPDAQIYSNAALNNTADANKLNQQNVGFTQDLAKMDKQQTGDMAQIQANAANAQKLASMNIDATKALNLSNQDFATFTNKSTQAANIVRDLQSNLTAIDQNSNFTDPTAKTIMKDNYIKTAKLALAVVTNATQDADLQKFMDEVFGA